MFNFFLTPKPKQAPEKIVCVLGMHRSGTSCLTGSLKQYGLDLAEHSQWNLHNKKGNMENNRVVALNDQILSDNGGSWDSPPRKIYFSNVHYKMAIAIIESYSGLSAWGFKDPRTLLTLNCWRRIVPTIRFVGIFRHPALVAQSLHKRGGGVISVGQALELWYYYNSILLKEYQKGLFPMMCFDWEEERFHDTLDNVINYLDFPRIDKPHRFFSNDLISNRLKGEIDLPHRITYLYHKLRTLADNQKL